MSKDKRMLVIGTGQVEASIIVWEVSTNLLMANIPVPGVTLILYVKMAYDNRHVLLVGLNKNYL